jgi:hypothetical protein
VCDWKFHELGLYLAIMVICVIIHLGSKAHVVCIIYRKGRRRISHIGRQMSERIAFQLQWRLGMSGQ